MKTKNNPKAQEGNYHLKSAEAVPAFLPKDNQALHFFHYFKILLLLMLCSGSLQATIWTVTSTANGGTGTLRALVDSVSAGDTIVFDSSIEGDTIVLTSGEIVLDKDVTIVGNGQANTIIDGNAGFRIFYIGPGIEVSLNFLTVTNGDASDGGGIYNESDSLAISHCTISDSKGDLGGGIYNGSNSSLNIIHSSIYGNGVDSGYGGGIYSTGTATIVNTAFTSNQSDRGGAIANNQGTMTLSNSTINNNMAKSAGGIYNTAGATLYLLNTTIANNAAIDAGGINNLGILHLDNSTIHGNVASGVPQFNNPNEGWGGGVKNYGFAYITNSTLSGNIAYMTGGGILSSGGGHLAIINSTITDNKVVFNGNIVDYRVITGEGGGIALDFDAEVVLVNSIVAGNFANKGPDGYRQPGLGSFHPPTGHNLIGDNSDFNMPAGNGNILGDSINPIDARLAPLANYGGATPTHALKCGSPAFDMGIDSLAPVNDQRGYGRYNTADAGAFESHSNLATSGKMMFVTNTNDVGPGSLREVVVGACPMDTVRFHNSIDGDSIKLTSGEIVIDQHNLIITGNGPPKTIIDGSGISRIFNIYSGASVSIDSVTVQNGFGNGVGGGIFCQEAALKMNNSVIAHNSAISGGGLFSVNGSVSLSNSTITDNDVSLQGGGLLISSDSGGITLTNSTISGNTARSGAGAFLDKGPVVVNNVTVSGNSATEDGAGIYLQSVNAVISNSTITTNSTSGNGGGLFIEGDTLTLINSIVAANQANAGPDGYLDGGIVHAASAYNLAGDSSGFGIPAGNNNILGNSINPINPLLASLANNGGTTKTHALLCGSPAYNAGSTDSITDQRGEPRGFGGADDIGAFESQENIRTQTTAFADSICPGDSLFVGGAWQNSAGVYTDTAISTAGCDSLLQTTLSIRSGSGCTIDSTETILYLVSDSGWTLSTEVTITTSNSFPWPGVASYVPHDSTFTLPAEVGQPFPWTHLYTVMGSEVIKACGGVSYYRYEFELTEHQALNARFRMFVDDDMQIFINRNEIALEDDMGQQNWRTANHDILFNDNGTVDNGYSGGDPFDTYTALNLDNVFQTGANDVILAIRNRTNKPDVGGFSFRMDLDKAGKGVIVKKEGEAFGTKELGDSFVVYPNPTPGNITVLNHTSVTSQQSQVKVYDLSGKLLQSKTMGERLDLDFSTYSRGVYLVKVIVRDKTYSQKVIKE